MNSLDQLSDLDAHSHVLFYEDKSNIERLMSYTDDNAICVEVGIFEKLKTAITDKYKIEKYPALLYRGSIIYDGDDIEERIKEIDSKNIHETKVFLDNFVLKKGITVFVKGTLEEPYCGYTKKLAALFEESGIKDVKNFNVLTDLNLKYYIKLVNKSRSFPMVYINGKFSGGLEATRTLISSGKLHDLMKF